MTLNYTINKPAHIVFNYLADMQKFASVHPVITRIDNIEDNLYLVFETMRFGFIPFSFTYPVIVNSNSKACNVCIKATVMKITSIEMMFSITTANGGTIVHEEINFTSLLPIKSLMQKIFTKQHKQLFLNIEKASE
ncbi:MAG: SRPBCC family protein [Chitinophagaceae bacterium]|jgi:hypothetical protein|nr:SRPBCC family protein [Chitinophagaceae bacterium]